MKSKAFMFIVAGIVLLYQIGFGGDTPIIFVHGISDMHDPDYCWPTWDHPSSAAKRIINEQYGGYSYGLNTEGKWECDENSTLQSTNDPRKIYNFSFYHSDGSRGVIGSNDKYLPAIDPEPDPGAPPEEWDWYYASIEVRENYEDAATGGSWANNFAIFIEKVLVACYGSNWQSNPNAKVDIVAHSMGGLVVRAAMKWYNMPSDEPVKDRIRKLLLIATPNKGVHYPSAQMILELYIGHSEWQRYGEDWGKTCTQGISFVVLYFRKHFVLKN